MKFLKIIFDSTGDHISYTPGQTITGQVILDLSRPMKITGIKLKWKGCAQVNWTQFIKRKGQPFVYTSDEQYFNMEGYIYGSQHGQPIILDNGIHSYPFSFNLPKGLPASFKGKYGSVEYSVEAIIKQKLGLGLDLKLLMGEPHRSKHEFTVNGTADLNLIPQAANIPQEICAERNLLKYLGQNTPVGLKVLLDQNGFLPGEFISFKVEMYNFSPSDISKTSVSLIQYITFNAPEGTNYARQVISVEKGPKLPSGKRVVWDCTTNRRQEKIRIPANLPPTNLGGCRIIDVGYALRFEIKIPFPYLVDIVSASVDIFIGTVPFRSNYTMSIPNINQYQNNWTSGSTDSAEPPDSLASTTNGPPSYEEAIGFAANKNSAFLSSGESDLGDHQGE